MIGGVTAIIHGGVFAGSAVDEVVLDRREGGVGERKREREREEEEEREYEVSVLKLHLRERERETESGIFGLVLGFGGRRKEKYRVIELTRMSLDELGSTRTNITGWETTTSDDE